jgi:hypothetical protein
MLRLAKCHRSHIHACIGPLAIPPERSVGFDGFRNSAQERELHYTSDDADAVVSATISSYLRGPIINDLVSRPGEHLTQQPHGSLIGSAFGRSRPFDADAIHIAAVEQHEDLPMRCGGLPATITRRSMSHARSRSLARAMFLATPGPHTVNFGPIVAR